MVDIVKDEPEVLVVKEDEAKEIFGSIKLNIDDTTKEKLRKNKVKSEVKEKSTVYVEEDALSLYKEFNSFLENSSDIIPDTGIKDTIATGIDLLDAILGGGFVIGALNIIVGQPGSGKSMLAMQTLAQAQKQFKGDLIGAFLDSEESTTTARLANLGVRYPKLKPYNDITIEKVFKFLEGLSVFKQEKNLINTPSVVIWDSIANTLSQKEREAEDINSVIGYKAKLLSLLIPKYVSKCAKNNICFIAVNQLRDSLQMGPYQAPRDLKFMSSSKEMPGGTVLKYNAFQLIEMKTGKVLELDKYGFDGILVKLKCVKNKLFTPNIEIEVAGSFTSGFSNFWTNYEFLKACKLLNSGAWNYLVSKPEIKFRTKDALDVYNTNEEFRQAFDKDAKDAIKTEIIDKFGVQEGI
jgi:RecA/RadA recombinase